MLLIGLLAAPAVRGGEFTAAYLIADGASSPLSLFLVLAEGEAIELHHIADCAAVTPEVPSVNIVLDDLRCDDDLVSVAIAAHGLVVEHESGEPFEIVLPAGPQLINGIPAEISVAPEDEHANPAA